jgi:ribonuclease D
VRDNVLLEIAYRLPDSADQLTDIDGMSPKLIARIGNDLLQAIEASSADENDYRPPRPPNESQKALLKELQARVARSADDLGIAAETVASKRELAAVIVSGKQDSRVFSGWRKTVIGDELLELF